MSYIMTSADKELHREFLEHISSQETRLAYAFLIDELSNLPQVTRCAPGIKGAIKHVLIDINYLNIEPLAKLKNQKYPHKLLTYSEAIF